MKQKPGQVNSSSILNRELGARVPWLLETVNLHFLNLSPARSPWLSPGRADKIPILVHPHKLISLAVIYALILLLSWALVLPLGLWR